MKKIMFVTHSSKKGGAEQSLVHLINNIPKGKFEVILVCPEDTEYINEIKRDCEKVFMDIPSIKKKLGIHYIKLIWVFWNLVTKKKIDIVHANGWRAPWYIAPIKFKKNVKIIWHHRDKFNSVFYNFILPFFFDKIICISEYVKSTLSPIFKAKYDVIYNGVDINSNIVTKNREFKQGNTFVIGTFGRIVEWKRFEYIIKACKIFSEKNPHADWRLYIVGGIEIDGSSSYQNKLVSFINQNKLNEFIQFTGHVNNPLEIMGQCDFTINFSDREPFGRVIIESMFAKTPVIVADSGGAPEILIKAGINNYISRDGDINDLVGKISKAYHLSTEDYDLLVQKGYTSSLSTFNMINIVEIICNLYNNLSSDYNPQKGL